MEKRDVAFKIENQNKLGNKIHFLKILRHLYFELLIRCPSKSISARARIHENRFEKGSKKKKIIITIKKSHNITNWTKIPNPKIKIQKEKTNNNERLREYRKKIEHEKKV